MDVPKTGIYAVRAEEAVDEPVTLEVQDFDILGLLGLACIVTCECSSLQLVCPLAPNPMTTAPPSGKLGRRQVRALGHTFAHH